MMRSLAWRRLLVLVVVFGLGAVAAFLDWRHHPPTTGPDGRLLNMRNGPGDLTLALEFYGVEFAIAALLFQPWRVRPRPGPIAIGALAFAVWGVLRWLVGLHSPTVMFSHDVLMLVVALALGVAAILLALPSRPDTPLKPVT